MADQAPPIEQGDTGAGPGGPEPLPYGEATGLNRDLSAAKQATAPPAVPTEPTPTEVVPTEAPSDGGAAAPPTEPASVGTSPQPVYNPSTDEEKFLFGTTTKPNEPVTAGLLASGRPAPPPGIQEWLPSLRAAAADPTAPDQTRLILAFVANEMG